MVKGFKLHVYAWIEFVIWLFILLFILGGVKIYQHNKAKELRTYQIFMSDVDGMIVGSPVKLMGVQVGYVQKIKVVNNTVYVKFVITDKNVHIPQGAIATVEFNGLGGSKSLEIYPPTEESIASKQIILVSKPKRLHDSITLLNEMFDKIDSMSSRGSYFANQFVSSSGKFSVNPDDVSDNIQKIDKFLDVIITSNKEFKEKF